jgi:Tfp pilus assembly protein PilF
MRRVLALVLLAGLCWAQGSRRPLAGKVVLRGATAGAIRVTIETSTRSFHQELFTDGAGIFSITVPTGEVIFTIQAEGYVTLRESMDVPPGSGPMPVDFMLKPMPPRSGLSGSREGLTTIPNLRVPAGARQEYEAGLREMERKRWSQARKRFEKALEKYADFPQALQVLARLDLAQGQPQRAAERLRRTVQIEPNNGEAFLLLSHALYKLGAAAEALEAGQSAVNLKPDAWQGHYQVGLAALSLGQEDLVLECSGRVAALAGAEAPEPRLLRAGVFLRRQQFTQAREQLEKFLELAPGHELAPLAKKTLAELPQKKD